MKMENEIILQLMQENPTMVKKDVNHSCVLSIDVDELHSFVKALNGEISQHWKKAIDFDFQPLFIVMHCTMCYKRLVSHVILEQKTRLKKRSCVIFQE